jgi:transposase InsO family protein
VIPFGERHLRPTIAAFIEHYHHERIHQGLGNELIDDVFPRRAPVAFVVASDSAESSTITIAPRDWAQS